MIDKLFIDPILTSYITHTNNSPGYPEEIQNFVRIPGEKTHPEPTPIDPGEGLKRWRERIWHVHFKDYSAKVGAAAKENSWDYFEAVKNGVFCELGKGEVDFPSAVNFLKDTAYAGWIVVEQDVLPGMGSPKICALNNRKYLTETGL